ncbi:hypothetical protein D1006_18810 [Burkholderia stabilis]|uniref:Uncharacterized protein n=1 Tax=Burkholderia stabilis TaxID=95485 RepID=A0A4Q2ADA4_9BURK|nr:MULTISPECIES: hypothetical protein [Burkholderia]RXV67337.1 hypothetical protein D1006_18810 [Burkholderia stabilis]
MTKQDTIALIVDPDSGERIHDIAAIVRHTWVVTSPVNDAVVKQIWTASLAPSGQDGESRVTTFLRYGSDRESWCAGILDAVDDHHNSTMHRDGYSILEVYGTPLSARLRQAVSSLGFSGFMSTATGFRATRHASAA